MSDPVLQRLKRNDAFLARLLTGVGKAEAVAQHGRCNSIAWIAGHVATSRAGLLKFIGLEDVAEVWEKQVARGAAKIADPGVDLAAIQAVFGRRGTRFSEAFPAVPQERLNAASGRTMPDGATTVAGALDFLLFHEAFHLGQIDLLRIAHGLPGIP